MMELNLRDKNGDDLVAKITTNGDFVYCKIYREVRGGFFSFYRMKLKMIKKECKWVDLVKKWKRRDYVNWAEQCVEIVNIKLEMQEDRERVANNIDKF